ncbi:PREDICTED: zinc finger protein 91 isoform X2 [Vollenhovia emeryi]|uniref:zinc finger protein 91 isoform X2 n=1 Tax=Vollenhovia emeryi TaxID=411798 RepID=UPI0005F4963B|nr:PREDICTED: zinc finger protein 91 isoform X2 [Vollenhovia emeryi]
MGSLNLTCPMCCGETFNNPQSLKYHLLSLTDNLYCPGCSQRSDSVAALIQHLDMCEHDLRYKMKPEVLTDRLRKGGKETELKMDLLMDVKAQQINRGFLATMGSNGIVIMGDSQAIQLDENVVEKMDTEETQPDENSLDFKMSEGLAGDGGGALKRPQPSQGLVAIPIASADRKTALMERNVIAVLPESGELQDGEATLIDVERVNEGEIDEAGLLRVKRELCELESDAVYSCTSCEMSFNSVLEHIKQFHDGQEVLLEMAEQLNDLATTSPVSVLSENSENVASARQRSTMNTLRTEECVDSEGRLYTKKVVQIERFWDRTPIQVTASQSAKAPMIEKFFSNVEGVKVREKRLASSMRMYKCNQCLQQFSKLGNFRVHACLRGSNRCEHCDQSFATPKALQLHAKVHDGEVDPNQKTFVCATCGTEFCSHKSLRLHSRMHAPVRARHVDAPEGTPNATFTCPECGKTLSESYKDAHMTLHTGDSVTCTVCNRKFDSADSLAMHAAVHVELAPPQSPIPLTLASSVAEATTTPAAMPTVRPTSTASIAVTSTTALTTATTTTTTAVTTADPGDSQKPYQCQHCGRRFTRPHEKVKHERIHTGEKPHACEVCGKTFRVSYCLTLHMRTHTGVRPYACQHCGKRFKASSVYNHHLLTHGEERAYTCPYCPKTFKTRVQLAGHKNSHTKPFRCTECSRPFASLYAVRSHIQTHKKDNNLKFSCYVCGASYGRAFALKDHLKQHGQDVLALPEPAREEEVHENFLLAEEGAEEDEFVAPPPPPPPPPSSSLSSSSSSTTLPVVARSSVNDTD